MAGHAIPPFIIGSALRRNHMVCRRAHARTFPSPTYSLTSVRRPVIRSDQAVSISSFPANTPSAFRISGLAAPFRSLPGSVTNQFLGLRPAREVVVS